MDTPENGPPSRTGSVGSSEQSMDSLMGKISDAGLYSLCGLVAISFHKMFPAELDREFREQSMSEILQYFGLGSKQVENSMRALMEGEGGSDVDFAELLKEEAMLKFSCLRVIEELVMFSIRNGNYDARLRVLILHVASLLGVPIPLVEMYEESLIEMLSKESPSQSEEQQRVLAKRSRNKKIKRYFMIGLVGLSGGAIMGLTGGLAAPFVAAGAGAIIGGAGAAALGSTAGIAIIGSLFGVAGAGLTGYKMKKRVGDIEEFAFDELSNGKELHITIAISGWISDKGTDSFLKPWRCLQHTREQYSIRYESSYLLELGSALEYFLGFVASMAAQEALKFTILSGIMAAIAWPATLVTVANVIDNPWGVCIRRSAEVGKHLASVLLSRQQGRRPVTLVGFSLGARVIFHCLTELAQHPGSEGIIQDAILLGAPVSGSLDQWRNLSKVVSGRIVNGYCRGDWLLKFLYRTSTASIKIAGLDAIDWKDRRMINVDLSDLVNGHLDYYKKLGPVLQRVGMQVDPESCNVGPGRMMRKCMSGMPNTDRLEMRQFRLTSIRMSISDPSFARWFYPTSQCFNTRLPGDNESIESGEDSIESGTTCSPKPLRRAHSAESVIARFSKISTKMTTSATVSDFQAVAQKTKSSEISTTTNGKNESKPKSVKLNGIAEEEHPLEKGIQIDLIKINQDLISNGKESSDQRTGAISSASSCSSSSGYCELVSREGDASLDAKSDTSSSEQQSEAQAKINFSQLDPLQLSTQLLNSKP